MNTLSCLKVCVLHKNPVFINCLAVQGVFQMPFDRFLVNHSVIAGARIPLKFLNKNSCFSGLNCTKVISSSEDT